jgi:hypothetical protein
MRILYLYGVDRGRDAATTSQLAGAGPAIELFTAASPPDAFARIRDPGNVDVIVISPALARSETLALIVTLRRDRVPILIVPVLTESQQEFGTAAIAAGADDVLLQIGGTLERPMETLRRLVEGTGPQANGRWRLRVLYVGDDDLVWRLLEQVPFVQPRRSTRNDPEGPVTLPSLSNGAAGCDVVLIDDTEEPAHQRASIASARSQHAGLAVIALVSPSLGDAETAALDLGPTEMIRKTGLYRRPLVTALERLHERLRPGGTPQVAAAVQSNGRGTPEPPSHEAAPAREPERPLEAARQEPRESKEEHAPERRDVDLTVERLEDHSRSADAAASGSEFEAIVEAGRTELRRVTDAHEAERAAWQASREELAARLEGVNSTQASLRRQLDDVRREIDEARATSRRATEALAAERDGFDVESAGWRRERDEYEARLAGAGRLEDERRALEQQLDRVRAELDGARAEAEAARAALDEARDSLRRAEDERAEADARSASERDAERATWTRERDAERAAWREGREADRASAEDAARRHAAEREFWESTRQTLAEQTARQAAEQTAERQALAARIDEAEARCAHLATEIAGHPAALDAERRRAAEAHERFIRRAPFGHAVMTRDGRLLECNDVFARLVGYADAAEAVGRIGDTSFAPFANRDALDARLTSGTEAAAADSCLDRVDGGSIRVLESASMVRHPHHGEIIERVVIDSSQVTDLEIELGQAQRLERVGWLASEMGPDLEAHLATVTTKSTRLAQGLDASHPQRAEADAVAAASARANGLVRQLLAFSRRQRREADPIDLNDVVGRATAALAQLVGPDISFEVRRGDLGPVAVGEDDLTQLLTALVVGARDLLPLGGQVRVDTAVRDGVRDDVGLHGRQTVLSIVATGYGVTPCQLSDAVGAIADRCGATLTSVHDTGRETRIEITFSRCGRGVVTGLSPVSLRIVNTGHQGP